MLALDRFFKNPFIDRQISNSELQNFSEDHLARLAAANLGGIYDTLLAACAAAYTAYFGELTNVALRSAVQKAATQTMNLRWREFIGYMTTRGEARVKDRAGKPSAIYTEFFPTGLSEYHNASIPDGQTLANRVRASATTHQTLLGTDFQGLVGEYAVGYLDAREAQMQQKGSRTDLRTDRDQAKATLQKRLFENLLALAAAEQNPDRCAFYFNQSLLEDPAAPEPKPPTP